MASETADGLTAARPPCRPGSRAIGETPNRVEVGEVGEIGEIGEVTRGERAPEQAQKLESNADSSATHGERRQNPRVEEFLLPGLDDKPEVSQVWQIEMQQAQPILPNGYNLEVKLLIVKTEVTSDISDCSYEIHNWVVLLTKVETAAKNNGEGDAISTTNRDVQVIVTVKDNKVDTAVTIKHPLKGGVRLANADQTTTDVGAEDVDVVTGVFPPGLGRGTGTEKTEQLENPLTFPKMETETNHNKLTEAPVNGSTLAERNSRSAIRAANEAAGEVHESAREIPKALQAVPSNAAEKATASDAAEGTGSRAPQLGGAESAPLLSSTSPEQRRRAVRREQVVKTTIAPPPSTAGRGGPPVQNGDRAKPRRNTQPKYEDVTDEGPKLKAGARRAEATAPAAENLTPEGKSSKDDIKDVCIGILHQVDEINVGSEQSIAVGARGADQESNWGAIEVAESGTPASKVTQRSNPTVAVEEASPACGGVPNKASHTSSEGTHRRDGEKALGVLESKDKIGVPKTGEIKESAEENCNNVMRTDDDAMEIRSFDESKQMENGSIAISPESPPFKTPRQSTTMQSGVQVALPELAPKQDVAQGSDEVKTDKRVPLLSNTTLKETKGNMCSEEAISEATTDVSARGITPADVHRRDTQAKPKKGFFSIFSFEKEKKSRQTAATNAANNKPNSTSKNECTAVTAAESDAELMAIKLDEDVHGTAGKGLNSVDFTDTQQNSCHPGVPLEAANTLPSSAGDPAFSTDIPTQKSHEDSIDTAKESEENAKVTSDNVVHGTDGGSELSPCDESAGEPLNAQSQLGPRVEEASSDGAAAEKESPGGLTMEKPPEKRWGFFSFFSFARSTSNSTPPQSPQPASDMAQEVCGNTVQSSADLQGSPDDGTTPSTSRQSTKPENDSDTLKEQNQQHSENSSTDTKQPEIDNATAMSREGTSDKNTRREAMTAVSGGNAGEVECRDATRADSEAPGEPIAFKCSARTAKSEADANIEKPIDRSSDKSSSPEEPHVAETINENAAVKSSDKTSATGPEGKPSRGFFTLFSFSKSTSKSDVSETEEHTNPPVSCSEEELLGEGEFLAAGSPMDEEKNGTPVGTSQNKKTSSFWFFPDIGFTEPKPEEPTS